MSLIKSRYSLCVGNSSLYQKFSGNTSTVIDGNPGYIWVPYILQESSPIVIEGDWKYWERIREIRKRREKIEEIIKKINDNVK